MADHLEEALMADHLGEALMADHLEEILMADHLEEAVNLHVKGTMPRGSPPTVIARPTNLELPTENIAATVALEEPPTKSAQIAANARKNPAKAVPAVAAAPVNLHVKGT